MRIRDLARVRVRYGYRMLCVLLKREGWKVGKHLVYRLYKEEGLSLGKPSRPRKRVAAIPRQEKIRAQGPNQVWSLDFIADQLADGRRFRALTVVDIFTRESLSIEVAPALKGTDVVRVLNHIKARRGAPRYLFCDNGSEFTGQAMDLWAHQHQVRIDFSRPGKPTDNAFIESFKGTFRSECLSTHWFTSIEEARQQIESWRQDYNDSRPHRALAHRTPSEFARSSRRKLSLKLVSEIRAVQPCVILAIELVQIIGLVTQRAAGHASLDTTYEYMLRDRVREQEQAQKLYEMLVPTCDAAPGMLEVSRAASQNNLGPICNGKSFRGSM
jgi:putative transposase